MYRLNPQLAPQTHKNQARHAVHKAPKDIKYLPTISTSLEGRSEKTKILKKLVMSRKTIEIAAV